MLFTSKDIKKIIVPLIIEQLFAVTIGMLDTVMVSHAGESAVSGVSLVDSLNLLMVYIFTALASGGAITISQLLGAGKKEHTNNAAKQLVWVVFSISTLIMAIVLVFRAPLLSLVFGSITKEVMANARIYFLFTAMSYPFLALYNAGASIFRAMGNSKISMKVSLIMNLLNFGGNALFIFVFRLGAAGAALSTLIARIVGAVIMLYLAHNKNLPVYLEKLHLYKPDFRIIKRICAIGIPNGMENGMFQFGKVITQSLISSFGTVQIAANAAASSLSSLQYTMGGAVGLTMITVVGQCVGAGEKEQAAKYAKKLLGLSYTLMASVAVIMAIFAKQLVGLFALSEQSASLAVILLTMHSVAIATVHPTAFSLTNSFRAANDVKFTMILSIISMWIFRVGLSFVFAKHLGMGVIGVWCAMFCDWTFRAICFGTRLMKGTWLTKYKALETE